MKKQLYQYAVLFHPTKEEMEKGEKSKIIVDLKTILASSEKEAAMIASREIPDTYLDKLDQVDVAIRPF